MPKWRIYFNKRGEYPWSIDEGFQTLEINVKRIIGDRCVIKSVYTGEVVNENSPVAWFEIEALNLEITNDVARFVSSKV